MSNVRPRRRYSGSFVWPVILIIIGLVLLLSNLGMLQYDLWGTLLLLWPVLLIALGIEGALRDGGIVGGAVIAGFGVLFLLSNLGYLALDVWEILFRLWPILLIAWGFDVMFGRRSIVLSLVGVVVVLAILGAVLVGYGVDMDRGTALQGEEIFQPLGEAEAARISLEPGAALLNLEALPASSDALVSGVVETGRATVRTEATGGRQADFSLRHEAGSYFFPGSPDMDWDLQLSRDVPLDLYVNLGVGSTNLDLRGLVIEHLEVDMGVGQVYLWLPAEGNYTARVDGGVGQLIIYLPDGLGVSLNVDTGLAPVTLPQSFASKGENEYVTLGYEQSENTAEMELDVGVGIVRFVEE